MISFSQALQTELEVVKKEQEEKMDYSFPSSLDNKSSATFSSYANYVPNPKPEWKRYKQYSKKDLESAIIAVQNGKTALQVYYFSNFILFMTNFSLDL